MDGKDVSGLCTTAEAHAYVEANALTLANVLTIIQAAYPSLNVIRTSAATVSKYGVARFTHKTNNDAGNNFGSTIIFDFTDTGVTNKILGEIGARRTNGSDDLGQLTFSVNTGIDLKMSLDNNGLNMLVPIAMGTNKITGCGDPTDPQDVATRQYVLDATILVQTLDQAFDWGKIIDGANSQANGMRVGDGDDYFATYALSNVPTLESVGAEGRIINIADPTNPQDVATKAYADVIGKVTPPAHAHGSDGFIISGETWLVAHTDLNARYNMTFKIPKTATYKILIIHRSTVATRTDAGNLVVNSRIGATGGNNWNESLPLVNLATNNWIFTRSSAVALIEGYVLYGDWQKNDNPGTGNLLIYGVWLEEQ